MDEKKKAEVLDRQFQAAFSSKECFTEEFVDRCGMPAQDSNKPHCYDNITTPGVVELLQNQDLLKPVDQMELAQEC